ncbi:flagellin [Anaerotignum sp.]|uniref:flagellin N-terminal helical domain-containing protein n=1 Tax=Anaerotignum sp. TaxID=2039241 RepID=UPI0033258C31
MRIQHNIAALNSHRQLGANNNSVGKNLEKLSSGYRINRAGDDAAGLAISEKMRAQIKGLETATKNANDGISLVQTAEGALTEVHSMLNRMVELATQSANGTYDNSVDRANLQKEVTSLKSEIDRISQSTNYNGIKLLDGSKNGAHTLGTVGASINAAAGIANIDLTNLASTAGIDGTTNTLTLAYDKDTNIFTATMVTGGNTLTDTVKIDPTAIAAGQEQTVSFSNTGLKISLNSAFAKGTSITATNTITTTYDATKGMNLQVGDTNDAFNKVGVKIGNMNSTSLGIGAIDISTEAGAGSAINLLKTAINTVSSTRGDLGAIQNRLEHTISNLGVTTENLTAAESRIRDVDMAEEMMEFTKNNILTQASQAMLAQANQLPQGVLQLLQ